ncbi:hypothetical protein C2E23DRAFT_860614 [Lenzites betulinus]|nr:hypothetical protein C2E23DRAFT_860614 [Lenzites betulinus]
MSRYNLRDRPAKAAAKRNNRTFPGEFISSVAELTSSPSPRTSIGTTSDTPKTDSEDEKRLTYSQAASSRMPSPELRVPEESPAAVTAQEIVHDNSKNIFSMENMPETSGDEPSFPGPPTKRVEEGQWFTAGKRGKHSRSSSTESEESCASLTSRGEGTSNLMSTRKGKEVMYSSVPSLGFEEYELDPEIQRRELEHYEQKLVQPENYGVPRSVSWAPAAKTTPTSSLSGQSSTTVQPESGRARSILQQIEQLEQELVNLQLQSPPLAAQSRAGHAPLPSSPSAFHLPKSTTPSRASSRGVLSDGLRRNKRTVVTGQQAPTSTISTRAHPTSPTAPDVNLVPASVLVSTTVDRARGAGTTPARAQGRGGLDPALRPDSQVEPSSYLGHAFRRMAGGGRDPGDSSPSSSSSGNSSEGSTSGSAPMTEDDVSKRRRRNKLKKLSRRERTLKSRDNATPRVPVLKPRDPDMYDGSPDAQMFHKFVQDVTEYIDGYQVPPERQAIVSEAEIAELALAAGATAERRQNAMRSGGSQPGGFGRLDDASSSHRGSRRYRDRARDTGPSSPASPALPRSVAAPSGSREPRSGGRGDRKAGGYSSEKPRKTLTDKDRDELRAAGKCYNCRETGHLSRNCPRSNQVSNTRSGKPPGLAAFSVGVAQLADTDSLRELADSSSRIETIEFNLVYLPAPDGRVSARFSDTPLSACSESDWEGLPSLHTVSVSEDSLVDGDDACPGKLHFTSAPPSEAFTEFLGRVCDLRCRTEGELMADSEVVERERSLPLTPRHGRPYVALGDVLADRAQDLLIKYQPYLPGEEPGDSSFLVGPHDIDHVSILYSDFTGATSDGLLLPTPDGLLTLSRACLADESFDVVTWFRALYQGLLRNADLGEDCELINSGSEVMGDAYSLHVAAVLNREIAWPADAEEAGGAARFTTFRYGEMILIEDAWLAFECQLELDRLHNARFDLPGWYAMRVARFRAADSVSDGLEGGLTIPLPTVLSSAAIEGVISMAADVAPVTSLQRNAAATKDFRRSVPVEGARRSDRVRARDGPARPRAAPVRPLREGHASVTDEPTNRAPRGAPRPSSGPAKSVQRPSPRTVRGPTLKTRATPPARVLPTPPETGRPETSREFAKRIHRVVLHGPRAARQEGARSADIATTAGEDSQVEPAGIDVVDGNNPASDEDARLNAVPRTAWI